MLQGQRVAASFCAQGASKLRPLRMISSSRLAEVQHPHQLRSSAPHKAKSVPTAKVLRERIKRTDDERLPRFLDCRKWKTTARPQTALRQPRNNDGPGATRFRDGRATARPLKLRRGPAAPEQETCGKHRELKRKLAERAPTQRKARAREEPSPGPPASETDARPLGHQPRGGAPARPRLSCGQESPT